MWKPRQDFALIPNKIILVTGPHITIFVVGQSWVHLATACWRTSYLKLATNPKLARSGPNPHSVLQKICAYVFTLFQNRYSNDTCQRAVPPFTYCRTHVRLIAVYCSNSARYVTYAYLFDSECDRKNLKFVTEKRNTKIHPLLTEYHDFRFKVWSTSLGEVDSYQYFVDFMALFQTQMSYSCSDFALLRHVQSLNYHSSFSV